MMRRPGVACFSRGADAGIALSTVLSAGHCGARLRVRNRVLQRASPAGEQATKVLVIFLALSPHRHLAVHEHGQEPVAEGGEFLGLLVIGEDGLMHGFGFRLKLVKQRGVKWGS